SRRRHTRSKRDWSSDVCSSDLSCFDLQSSYCHTPLFFKLPNTGISNFKFSRNYLPFRQKFQHQPANTVHLHQILTYANPCQLHHLQHIQEKTSPPVLFLSYIQNLHRPFQTGPNECEDSNLFVSLPVLSSH